MIKRVTLLKRKDGMSDADFRKHWAEPHAEIAKGFEGLRRYNQNRVDAVLWETGDARFDMHGIVELWFASQEAVARNAASATTRALIEDEPKFLSGLTALSVGESWINTPVDVCTKHMIFAVTNDLTALQNAIQAVIAKSGDEAPAEFSIDPLALSFMRKTLSSEPVPPNALVTIWTSPEASEDLVSGANSRLREVCDTYSHAATAYLVDELRIV